MPAMRGEAQAPAEGAGRSTRRQIDALGAYVQANGGGPSVPRDDNGEVAQESLLGDDVARGGDLFRLNCASCHNFTGKGGALSSGKYAPDLGDATPAQIYTAMLTGPQNMPKFSDRQLSPEEKRDIVAYVHEADGDAQPRRLRPRRLRPGARGHGGLDHRHGGRHRRGPVDRSASMSERSNGTETRMGPTHPVRRGSRASPPTPNWPRCRARSCSNSAASSTASRSSSRTTAGRSRAPRPRSGPSARWRTGFCWADFGSGAAAGVPVLAVGVQAAGLARASSCTAWPHRCTG